MIHKYRGGPNISVGVLGFVDDTLELSECGKSAVVKNAVINSFAETHRQKKMHQDKNLVVQVRNAKKCD